MQNNNIEKPNYFKFLIGIAIIALSQFSIELWLENCSEPYYKFISETISFSLVRFVVNFLIMFAISWYFLYDMRDYYHKKISEKEEVIKCDSLKIWNKYHELKEYRTIDYLKSIIDTELHKNFFLSCVQFYKLVYKSNDNKLSIKINYSFGSVKEGININNMMQQYSNIDSDLFYEFKTAIDNFDLGYPKKVEDFLSKNIEYLRTKNENDYEIYDAYIYDFIIYTIQYISDEFSNYNILSIISKTQLQTLAGLNRLGLLRGILHKELYLYSNEKNKYKENRLYVTQTKEINRNLYLIIFTFDKNIITHKKDFVDNIKETCYNIVDSFEAGKLKDVLNEKI